MELTILLVLFNDVKFYSKLKLCIFKHEGFFGVGSVVSLNTMNLSE